MLYMGKILSSVMVDFEQKKKNHRYIPKKFTRRVRARNFKSKNKINADKTNIYRIINIKYPSALMLR